MEKNSTLYSKTLSVPASEETARTGIDPAVDIRDDSTICPSDNVIKNILSFSKALKIIPSGGRTQIGAIEMVIN